MVQPHELCGLVTQMTMFSAHCSPRRHLYTAKRISPSTIFSTSSPPVSYTIVLFSCTLTTSAFEASKPLFLIFHSDCSIMAAPITLEDFMNDTTWSNNWIDPPIFQAPHFLPWTNDFQYGNGLADQVTHSIIPALPASSHPSPWNEFQYMNNATEDSTTSNTPAPSPSSDSSSDTKVEVVHFKEPQTKKRRQSSESSQTRSLILKRLKPTRVVKDREETAKIREKGACLTCKKKRTAVYRTTPVLPRGTS